MPVDAATFRAVLGQWPSGVTVVTTTLDGAWHGMTASSFSSVSLDPPLVSVCLAKKIYTHSLIETSGVFGINILAKDQAGLGKRFAGQQPEVTDRFFDVATTTADTGAPLFGEALAWLDCRVLHAYDGGDHTIFVGEVMAADTPRLTAPLLFHSRAWGQFADLLPEDAAVMDTGVAKSLMRAGAPAPRAIEVLSGLRKAGVCVRLVDMDHLPPPELLTGLDAGRDAGPGTASALVWRADQVPAAADLGVGVVEVLLSPGAGLDGVPQIVPAARERELAVSVTIRSAFERSPDDVLATCEQLSALGVDEICLDDSASLANPLTVRTFLQEAVSRTRPTPLALRLGDASGLALANALTALKSGVRRFHATLGGLDGITPLEDLLYLIAALEVDAPADRDAVLATATALATVTPAPLRSRTGALPTPKPTELGGTP